MNIRSIKMMAAAAAVILASSCSSEQERVDCEIRLKAAVEQSATATRANTGIQGEQFDYNANTPELINVEIIDAKIDNNGNQTSKPANPVRGSFIFNTTNTSGGMMPAGTTPYFPNSGNKVNIFAYYPSTVGTTGTVTTVLPTTFTVQTDQSTQAGYKQSDLMYGEPTGGNPVARTTEVTPMKFEHKLSKVVVKLQTNGNGLQTADLANATVTMKAMKSAPVSIAGDAESQTWTSDGAGSVSMGGVTVNATVNTIYETAAIVVPQTIAKNSENVFTITIPNHGTCNYTPKKNDLSLESGKVHVFVMTLSKVGITNVTATVADWTEGDNTGLISETTYVE